METLGFDKKLNFRIKYAVELQFEPVLHKTNKMTCAASKNSDQSWHPPSLISLCCPHEETS